MPFPEVRRVIYHKNPLYQVICQLRFPSILRIDVDVPAAFQDRVRDHFPTLSESTEVQMEVVKDDKVPIPPEVLTQLLKSSGNRNYEFSSEGGDWKVNLTRNFIALTCSNYERWEKFRDKLSVPVGAVVDIYSPPHFSRVGLRYIDVISRSKLNLENVGWDELLQPYILGILGSPGVGERVGAFESGYEIRLSDEASTVRLVTKFVAAPDGEISYMIDSDFYIAGKTELNETWEKLDYFNKRSSRLIQWCITERLHQAMEPEII